MWAGLGGFNRGRGGEIRVRQQLEAVGGGKTRWSRSRLRIERSGCVV